MDFKLSRYRCLACKKIGRTWGFSVYTRCRNCSSYMINPLSELRLIKGQSMRLISATKQGSLKLIK